MNAFDHYVALDWSMNNMAIARLSGTSDRAQVVDVPTDIAEVKLYLQRLKGRKIICFEESTPAQWLYLELKPYVDELIVCDPYRNHLLKDGGKTDKLDAIRLAQLLRAGLLKPVFHCESTLIKLRRVVHGYQELVCLGVRLKNQKTALLKINGLDRDESLPSSANESVFVFRGIEEGIAFYEKEKKRYETEFRKLSKEHSQLRTLQSIPGIGLIGAMKVLAVVVDARRFPSKSRWLSYCGLIRHDLISGGRTYGRRLPRYNRILKSVFKTAALSAIGDHPTMYRSIMPDHSQPLKRYYQHLIQEKNYPPYHARHAVARRIAVLTLGVLKSSQVFEDRWGVKKEDERLIRIQT